MNGGRSENGAVEVKVADRIRTLRLYLHRRIDRLFDQVTDKDFTGKVGLELSVKDGRPGDPREIVERWGVREE